MDSSMLPAADLWPSIAALFLAVITPFSIWCVYAFRQRQSTIRSLLTLAATEIAALATIAILASY